MWSQTYGGADNDYASSLIEASDGGYAIAGTWNSTTYYELDPGLAFQVLHGDFWLVKTDKSGNMVWNQTYGGTADDGASSLVATSDGGYAIAGLTGSLGAGMADFWLVKTDAVGNMQWNKTYGGSSFEMAYSMVATSDGGYAIAGFSESFGPRQSYLVKTDAVGNMEWNKTYGSPYFASSWAWSLVATSDGGYAMACDVASFEPSPNTYPCLMKTDALGNMVWNQTYGGQFDVHAVRPLIETSDGGYALAGLYESEFWLIKTNSNGVMEWNRTYGGTGAGFVFSLVEASDGGYVLAGNPDSGLPRNSLLVKTDALGNMEWNMTYVDGNAYSSIATSDGGYALAGYTQSFGAGGWDFWLVKTDELGVYPEYSSWLVPTLALTATAFIIITKKKRYRLEHE